MKVIEHIAKTNGYKLISFEVIPPRRYQPITKLEHTIETILEVHDPPFINVTGHAAVLTKVQKGEHKKRRYLQKSIGTLGVSALIKRHYKKDTVFHVICKGVNRDETEDFLLEHKLYEIDNVLALTGDDNPDMKPPVGEVNEYAVDLIKQIVDMKRGKYFQPEGEDKRREKINMDFCIGMAGYPEGHTKSGQNIETDLNYVKDKQDAGAQFMITQMCFDNLLIFNYIKQCRENGISVPIIPGLKIISNTDNLQRMKDIFHIQLPDELESELLSTTNKAHKQEIGLQWAVKQVEELLNYDGIPGIHFFVLQDPKPFVTLFKRLGLGRNNNVYHLGNKIF